MQPRNNVPFPEVQASPVRDYVLGFPQATASTRVGTWFPNTSLDFVLQVASCSITSSQASARCPNRGQSPSLTLWLPQFFLGDFSQVFPVPHHPSTMCCPALNCAGTLCLSKWCPSWGTHFGWSQHRASTELQHSVMGKGMFGNNSFEVYL